MFDDKSIMLEKMKQLFAVLLLAGMATQPTLFGTLSQDNMAFGHAGLDNGLGEIVLLFDQQMREI